jgi:hypothetical protein
MELDIIDKKKYLSSIGLIIACDENKIINWSISIDWNKLFNVGKNGYCVYFKFANINEIPFI